MSACDASSDLPYHPLCANLEIPLDIPESQGTRSRCQRLRKAQISILQETEREFVVLTD
jgi:hypothetical protein